MAIAIYVIKTRMDETASSRTDADAESAHAVLHAELGTTTGLWPCMIGRASSSAASGDVAAGGSTDDTGGNGAAESQNVLSTKRLVQHRYGVLKILTQRGKSRSKCNRPCKFIVQC